MMSDESNVWSSFWSSDRIPIVTLSKSIRSAALGAWTGVATPTCWRLSACGPRWTRAFCARGAGRVFREFIQDLCGHCPRLEPARRPASAHETARKRKGREDQLCPGSVRHRSALKPRGFGPDSAGAITESSTLSWARTDVTEASTDRPEN